MARALCRQRPRIDTHEKRPRYGFSHERHFVGLHQRGGEFRCGAICTAFGYSHGLPKEIYLCRDAHERALVRSLGAPVEELEAEEIKQLEPNVSRDYRYGVYFPDTGHCLDPYRLTRALAEDVRAAGGQIRQAEVRTVEVGEGGARRLLTDGDPIEVDAMVLAAGAWSGPIAAALGSPAPLDTERGYHTVLHGVDAGIHRPGG